MSLRVAVLAFAALGLLCSGTSLASSPKPERVFVNAIVEQVGPFARSDMRPVSYATVHVRVSVEDVDPSAPSCSSCQTADTGWIEITKVDSDDLRNGLLVSAPVAWVRIGSNGGATVAVDGCFYNFVDGGSPGNEPVGPPGPGGLVPTRDSMSINCIIGPRGVQGSLIGGTVRID